jgi:hypothetical protein
MVRKGVVVLGVALALLCALGLAADRRAVLLWFDAVAAVLSFGAAGLVRERELGASRGGGPAVLGLGLGVLWAVGLAARQQPWAVWANFALACAYLVLAIAAATRGHRQAAQRAHARS